MRERASTCFPLTSSREFATHQVKAVICYFDKLQQQCSKGDIKQAIMRIHLSGIVISAWSKGKAASRKAEQRGRRAMKAKKAKCSLD